MTFKEYLLSKNACGEALIWVKDRTSTQAWEECDRCDWLCWWYFTEKKVDLNIFVKIAKELANFVQKYNNNAAIYSTRHAIYSAKHAALAARNAADAAADAAYAADYAALAADANNKDHKILADIVRSNIAQPWSGDINES